MVNFYVKHGAVAARSLAFLSLTGGLLVGSQGAAQAEDVALSFALPDSPRPQPPETPKPDSAPADAPLPVPPGADKPPMTQESIPTGVYGGGEAIAIVSPTAADQLPPPPPLPAAVAMAPVGRSSTIASEEQPPVAASNEPIELAPAGDQILAFESPLSRGKPAAPTPSASSLDQLNLFDGGSDSLVARVVGSAEGTRTAEGLRTPAYFGHLDPGNGVWNLGTFSYQHGATTPEAADAKQLRRLQAQTQVLAQKALERNLELTLEEKLNGIDLANQAPLAALGREGYIDWLARSRQAGLSGADAIVWARTRSFLDPDTRQWNAPGLGNTVESISRDQERRMGAIDRALAAYGLAPEAAQTPVAAEAEAPSPPESLGLPFPGLDFELEALQSEAVLNPEVDDVTSQAAANPALADTQPERIDDLLDLDAPNAVM